MRVLRLLLTFPFIHTSILATGSEVIVLLLGKDGVLSLLDWLMHELLSSYCVFLLTLKFGLFERMVLFVVCGAGRSLEQDVFRLLWTLLVEDNLLASWCQSATVGRGTVLELRFVASLSVDDELGVCRHLPTGGNELEVGKGW